eukprot:Gb_10605 [translate_table: standard]
MEEIHWIILQWRSGFVGDTVCFSREELKQMHYLHAALTQTMSLYPPVPLDKKQATEDLILPDGTPMKKGMSVNYVIYAMGRMESI